MQTVIHFATVVLFIHAHICPFATFIASATDFSGPLQGPDIYLAAAQFYLKRKRDFARVMELHKMALRRDPFHIPTLLSYARFLEYDRWAPKAIDPSLTGAGKGSFSQGKPSFCQA